MPYPLPEPPATAGAARVRLLPPIGCPGLEQWVLPMEFGRWSELGYRRGPIPADDLELFWLPADPRWNEPIGSCPIELLINPRQSIPSPITVSWGDGSSNVVPWPAVSRTAPRLRHVYAQRADVTVQVQLGMLIASLRVALVGCPVPPSQLLNNRDGGGSTAAGSTTSGGTTRGGTTRGGSAGVIQPLIPSGGISGQPYDGRHAVIWRLRLHPNGGLGLMPDPASGEPALAVVQESGVGSRATRWYSGDASGSGSSSISLNLASIGTAGTYTKVTTDAKGRVTAGSALTATDIPALTAAKISDFNSQVRSNRLDQLAAPTADLSLNNRRISGLADPAAAQDAATKAYVDATRQGLDVKDSVRVATTSSITLSGTQTIDGIAVLAGNRVLVKNQASASANGIYIAASGSWSRATDFDSSAKVSSGAFCFVEEGTTQADSGWILTTDGAITLGTTALTFAHFSGAGQIEAGSGLTKTGNTLNIASASARRIVVTADAIDLATLGTAGSYRAVTVDAYGRVTAGSNPTTLAGYGISDGQPLDATLTALAGITTGANQLIYATGADAFSTTALTAFGRSLLADADAAAARTSLGLGSLATQSANNVAISGGVISGITIDGGTF
jgi:phage-related tail fiber protein